MTTTNVLADASTSITKPTCIQTQTQLQTQDRIINRIKRIIKTHTYLDENKHGGFEGKIYADYRDRFDKDAIKKIFNHDGNNLELAYEMICEGYADYDHDCRYEVFETIKKYFDDEDFLDSDDFLGSRDFLEDEELLNDDRLSNSESKSHESDNEPLDFATHEGFIHDWVMENVCYSYPYDHYFKEDVLLNIMVDTGDGNHDFTLNNLLGNSDSEKSLEGREQSSLVWLMQQQGYSMDSITDFIEKGITAGSKLLESVEQECENTTSSMNALTFFVQMPLGDALELHGLIHDFTNADGVSVANDSIKGTSSSSESASASSSESAKELTESHITIAKGTSCGLFNPWDGSGSALEIELEQDVILPLRYIDSIKPDGCQGYGAYDVYGLLSSFWSRDSVKINGLPQGEPSKIAAWVA